MILTRSTRLSQPQGPVEISPDFGGAGVVYLPNVRSGITRVAGTVGRAPTPQGVSASYTAGAETKIERLNGSAPNGLLEFTQIVYLTPIAGGQVNDRGLFGNRNTTGITSYIQLIHVARDATTNGRYCYRLTYKPTAAASEVAVRTSNDTAADDVPSVVVASAKNGKLSIYHNGALQGSTAVTLQSVSGQLDLQFGNYFDNTTARRLSAQIHLGAFLPRGVTDAEAFALSENPWQLFRPVQRRVYFDMGAGGSTTAQVSTDLTGEYAVRSAVQADAATSYAIRAAVQSDRAGTYAIRTSASADLSAGYDILNATAVSSDMSASYLIRSAVQAEALAEYAVRGSVAANSPHAFMVRGLVSSDASASYAVEGARYPVSRDLSASYVIEVAGGYPMPDDVRKGVQYGPNGNDYTGTLVGGKGTVMLRRR